MTTTLQPSDRPDVDLRQQSFFETSPPLIGSPPPPNRPERGGAPGRFLAGMVATLVAVAAGFGIARVTEGDEMQPSAPPPAAVPSPRAMAPTPPVLPDAPVDRITAVAAAVGPAVVQLESETGLGSGVIYRDDGFILTAAHVVGNAGVVNVRLEDGRLFEGRILGAHRPTDIAVIRIDATGLPTAALGYRDSLETGEIAIALGSPFGFDQTVTAGIVSAVNRTINGVPMVQTDAAINPGNSGGPLVDGNGNVIGINDVIFTESGGNDGIGFAVSIDVAIIVADQITAGRDVQLAVLGVASAPSTSGDAGAVVQRVVGGSPAQEAGVEIGDRIVAVGGSAIDGPQELFAAIITRRPGSTVDVEVVRNGGLLVLTAVLGSVET